MKRGGQCPRRRLAGRPGVVRWAPQARPSPSKRPALPGPVMGGANKKLPSQGRADVSDS